MQRNLTKGGCNALATLPCLKSGQEVDMNRERERKRASITLLMLLALMIGLVACGGQDVPQTGTIWDSGRFDQSTWQ
jgi:hypothetical protein